MKENSLPVVKKLHVKVGDTVKVISGHDKGKIGAVTQVYTHNSKVMVKDVNLKTKHVKGKAEGESGQIVQVHFSSSLEPFVFINLGIVILTAIQTRSLRLM